MMASNQVNGAQRFDELRARIREVYMAGINDVMDRCLDEFIMPDDKATICSDAAQFLVMLMATKAVESQGLPPTRANLLAAYWPIEKAIKKEVPASLLELSRSMENAG